MRPGDSPSSHPKSKRGRKPMTPEDRAAARKAATARYRTKHREAIRETARNCMDSLRNKRQSLPPKSQGEFRKAQRDYEEKYRSTHQLDLNIKARKHRLRQQTKRSIVSQLAQLENPHQDIEYRFYGTPFQRLHARFEPRFMSAMERKHAGIEDRELDQEDSGSLRYSADGENSDYD